MIKINPTWFISLLVACILSYGALGWWSQRAVSHGPGVIAPNAPEQEALGDAGPFDYQGYTLQPLARFSVEARVLSREDYHFDAGAGLAPVDLALGWGPMSDETVIAQLSISQSGRFYSWRADELPIPREQIEQHSANMHLIPADDRIERKIKRVRPGQIVRFSGFLVEARGAGDWRWRSSLTRNDTGNGACELIWIEDFSIF
jgi:hypothetical protein